MKHEVDKIRIEKQFEEKTGISRDLICELREAFPISLAARILLLEKEFEFTLSFDGRNIKEGSIKKVEL